MAFQPHDVVPDSPINNFATLNPNDRNVNSVAGTWGSSAYLTDGNLVYYSNSSAHSHHVHTVFPKGIWYFEIRVNNSSLSFLFQDERKDSSNSLLVASDSGTHTRIYAICVDSITGKLWFKVNSKITEDVVAGNSPQKVLTNFQSCCFTVTDSWASRVHNNTFNFGQDASFGGLVQPSVTYQDANGIGQFYYQPPAGALALCTQNIPSGPINVQNDDVPSDYMKAVTYTGNGGTNDVDTGIAFDLLWLKNRDGSNSHVWSDSVRGKGANGYNILQTNSRGAEYSGANVQEFLSIENGNSINGMRLASNGGTNGNGTKFIAWCWKAAGAPADNQARIIDTNGSLITKSTADLKNETGASITPSKVSANRKSGFSIVKYTGTGSASASVPHGLSSAPEMVVVKSITESSVTGWHTSHIGLSSNHNLIINGTDASWNPGSNGWVELGNANTFELKAGTTDIRNTNKTGVDFIAYCWHSVPGYSKFGSYVGNGSADGTYVELGFRPAWVMIKSTGSGRWAIFDTARSPYNVVHHELYAEDNIQEHTTDDDLDLLSNGFKIRRAAGMFGATSQEYIFMAFAEAPMNAPSNAR